MSWPRLFFGFKWVRFNQWVHVVHMAEESPNYLGLIREAIGGTMGKLVWRRRIRRCMMCPLFDPVHRRCRPFKGSELGCGCYCPLIALFYRHPCWGRIVFPDVADIGWD